MKIFRILAFGILALGLFSSDTPAQQDDSHRELKSTSSDGLTRSRVELFRRLQTLLLQAEEQATQPDARPLDADTFDALQQALTDFNIDWPEPQVSDDPSTRQLSPNRNSNDLRGQQNAQINNGITQPGRRKSNTQRSPPVNNQNSGQNGTVRQGNDQPQTRPQAGRPSNNNTQGQTGRRNSNLPRPDEELFNSLIPQPRDDASPSSNNRNNNLPRRVEPLDEPIRTNDDDPELQQARRNLQNQVGNNQARNGNANRNTRTNQGVGQNPNTQIRNRNTPRNRRDQANQLRNPNTLQEQIRQLNRLLEQARQQGHLPPEIQNLPQVGQNNNQPGQTGRPQPGRVPDINPNPNDLPGLEPQDQQARVGQDPNNNNPNANQPSLNPQNNPANNQPQQDAQRNNAQRPNAQNRDPNNPNGNADIFAPQVPQPWQVQNGNQENQSNGNQPNQDRNGDQTNRNDDLGDMDINNKMLTILERVRRRQNANTSRAPDNPAQRNADNNDGPREEPDGWENHLNDMLQKAAQRAVGQMPPDDRNEIDEWQRERRRNNRPGRQPTPQQDASDGWLSRIGESANNALTNFGGDSSSPSSTSSPGSTFGSGSGSFPVVPVLLILIGAGIVFWFVRRNEQASQLAKATSVTPVTMPKIVESEADVVQAFHALAARTPQVASDAWTHNRAANAMIESKPANEHDVEVLAELYEQARYRPADEALTSEEIVRARRAIERWES